MTMEQDMSALYQTESINFSSMVNKEMTFDAFSSNELYNLSMPVIRFLVSLSRLPEPDNALDYRAKLREMIITLSDQGRKLDYPTAVIDKLCCLHCIVIDEFVIHSHWGEQSGWENNTLLSELFGYKNGGELFFTVLDKAIKQADKMTDLLEIAYLYLQIGFKGRYRSRQSEQLGLITQRLAELLGERIKKPNVILADIPKVTSRNLRSGINFLTVSVAIVIALVVITLFVDYGYDQSQKLRAAPFTELEKSTENDILNSAEQDIVYISNAEDIHALHQAYRAPKSMVKSAKSSSSKQLNEVNEYLETPLAFRVQLASFSSESNASAYINQLGKLSYQLKVKPLHGYYIVFGESDSLAQAKQMKAYFADTFSIKHILITSQD